jgi:hypothetical protein
MRAHRRSIGLEGRLTGCAVRVMDSWPGELRELREFLEVGQAGVRASSRLERGSWEPGARDTSAGRPAPIGWIPNQPRQPHTSAIGVTSSSSKRFTSPQARQVGQRPAHRPPSHLGIAQRQRIDRADRIRITAAQLPLGDSPHARGVNAPAAICAALVNNSPPRVREQRLGPLPGPDARRFIPSMWGQRPTKGPRRSKTIVFGTAGSDPRSVEAFAGWAAHNPSRNHRPHS